jgi:hypothetical protein
MATMTEGTYEIYRTLTLSTAHITNAVTQFIENEDIASFNSEFGYIIYTEYSDDLDYPEELKRVLELAREKDCAFLRLDRDGPVIEDLPSYDW